MTPHNEAKKEEIAKVVLMPGDPLRAKYIAENYLQDYKLVNQVRGMYAYTGKYKGKEITVMAHGMGIPSVGIYSYELFKVYDVDAIIRIGSCGAYTSNLDLKDLILVEQAYSESTYAKIQNGEENDTLKSSNEINNKISETAQELNISINKGKIHCTDVFYSDVVKAEEMLGRNDCIGVEMESFALFHNANALNKKAACILTVTDSLVDKTKILTSEERQTGLNNMITLALETAIKI